MSPGTHGGANQAPASAQAEAKPAPPKKLSRRRRWLFRLAAVVLGPALAFGCLELVLRVAGYGYPTAFFLDGSKVEGAAVWVDNPAFGRRMFPRSLHDIPQPVPFALPKVKAEGTYRVFVLGESAAQGFPDPATSFARVLEVMLRAAYPERRFEVVNTAMVAINSHVALPIARECAEHQPDLLVVHLGNNEVVGPFGAAGVLGPFAPNAGLVRANLAIKTARSGQLLDRVLRGLGRGQPSPTVWDGMAMFVNSRVRDDDGRLPPIYAHFRQNLDDVCRAAESAGAPVVLCTIPVNLKDCAPFGSLHAPGLDGERLQEWERLYQDGQRLQAGKKYAEAVRRYEQAGRIDDSFADLAYRLGACFAALGENEQARRQYLRARDLDVYRFRSDATINDTVRAVAAAHEAAGARLADAERSFAEGSPGGLPGEDLFLEHVHMTFRGSYLLARTVFEALTRSPPPGLGPPVGRPAPLSESDCAERLAYTEWSELEFGTKMYDQLLQGPPFTFQADHKERCRRWEERLVALRSALHSGGMKKAIAGYRKAVQRDGRDWMLRLNFGQLLTEAGQWEQAKEQYEALLDCLHHSVTGHCKLGTVKLKLDLPRAAETEFREALRLQADSLEANLGLAEALEGQGKTQEAQALFEGQVRTHPKSAAALDALGRYLYRAGKLEEARGRFTEALEREPNRASIHVDLGMTALKQDRLDEAVKHFEEALRLQPDWPEVSDFLAQVRKRRDQGAAARGGT